MLRHFLQRQLILVTGKGGVGKTSCGLSLAYALSEQGKKVLFCEIGGRASSPIFLGLTEVKQGAAVLSWKFNSKLTLTHLETSAVIQDYFRDALPYERLVRFATNNKILSRLWAAAPSFNEFVLLNSIEKICQGTHPRFDERYDHVVVDLHASGHAVTMLGVPKGINRIAKFGAIAERATAIGKILYDSRRTALTIVTIPEELPVQESVELKQRLQDEVGMSVECVILNLIRERHFSEKEGTGFERLLGSMNEGSGKALIRLAATEMKHRQRQEHWLGRIKDCLAVRFVELPVIIPVGRSRIEKLATVMGEATLTQEWGG